MHGNEAGYYNAGHTLCYQRAHLIECLNALGLCVRPLTAPGGIQIVLILPDGDGTLSKLLKQWNKLGF